MALRWSAAGMLAAQARSNPSPATNVASVRPDLSMMSTIDSIGLVDSRVRR